MALDVCLCDAF
ncbi:hypothetical protein EC575_24750, partial [Vibrio cholerae]